VRVIAKILVCFTVALIVFSNHVEGTSMKVESSAFKENSPIPTKYTCQGEDISPPLNISNIPNNTKSLAIIVEDLDAPSGTFDHWIAWNLSPTQLSLSENAQVPMEGLNHFNETGYRGPCPPKGKAHRYFFKVYALDKLLELSQGSSKQQLEASMKGHILGQGELVGTFQRS
jgi:Raf kinase inhibitor-like YbhB/YbcL family protein